MFPLTRSTAAAIAALTSAALIAAATASPPGASSTAADPAPGETSTAPVQVEDGHTVRVRRTYRAAATAVPDTVEVGTAIRIHGTAVTRSEHRATRRRPVRLLERTGRRWQQVARKRTTRAGAFRFRLRAGEVAQVRVFRVRARRFHGLPATRTGVIRVAVVEPEPTPVPAPEPAPEPAPDPVPEPVPGDLVPPEPLPTDYQAAGSATDWSYLFAGGSRWNPCEPIRWAYNPKGQGYAGLADVYRAFAKISGVSELQFRYVGETSWRYLGSIRDPDFPDQVDITVSWADEAELDDLAGPAVGIAGGSGAPAAEGTDVGFVMSRGYVALDNGHALPGGFDGPGWGQVLLHEMLHALGMGHAKGTAQVMYPVANAENTRFGAGDLTGMTRVGLASGCLG